MADHAYACADGLGHIGALVTCLAPELHHSEKAEIKMARILMLVVFASLLSFGKLSVLFYYRAQVLASIQFSSVRFLG